MIRRWLARLLFALGVLLVLLLVVLVAATRTAPVRELVRQRAEAMLRRATDAEIRIGAIGGSLFHTLVVEDLRVVVDGRTVVRVPRLEASYALFPLVRGKLRLARVTITGPRLRAVRTAAGWRLPHGREREGGGAALAVQLEHLVVEDGRVAVALDDAEPPRRFAAAALALEAAARLEPRHRTVDIATLRFVPRGVALSPVSASVRLAADADGPVRVSDLAIATSRSRIEARAALERGRWVDARGRLAPLAAADVRAVLPRAGLGVDVRADMRVRGPWSGIVAVAHAGLGPGGDVVARARADATADPVAYRARVDATALDPGAAVATLPRASINGRVEVDAHGVDPRAPMTYRVALRDSTVMGRQVDRLTLAGAGARGVHRLHAEAAAPLGAAALRARLALRETPRYRATARWTLARLDLVAPSAWGWAAGRLRAAGRGTAPDRRHARVELDLTGASVRGIPVDRAAVRASVDGEQLALGPVMIEGRDVGVRVDGRGAIDLAHRRGSVTLDAGADLGAIGAYLAMPLAGRATAAASARGELDALALEATATIDEPAYRTVAAERMRAGADLRGLGGAAPGGTVHVDADRLRVSAGAEYALRADADWRRSGGEDRADLALTAAGEKGRTQEVRGNVVRGPETTRARIERLTLTPPEGAPWRLVRPAVITIDSAIRTDGLELAAPPERLAVAGRVALRDGTSDASVSLERIDLGQLCALVGGPACAGALSGRAGVGGTPTAPRFDVGIEARDVEVERVPYGVVSLDAHYAELAARLRGGLRHPTAGEVRFEGEVPIDLAWSGTRRDLGDAPLSIAAHADHLDLTFLQALAPRALRSSAGRLTFDVQASGPRRSPRVDGQLGLDDGRIELAATGIPYENIRARIEASGTHVTVREIHADAGDGHADVTGSVEVVPGGTTAVDLAARLDEFFAVRREAYEAVLSGSAAVGGSVGAPAVSGTLAVDRAVVRPAGLPASGPSIPRDPTIVVVGTPEAAPEAPAAPGTELAGPLKLAVQVTIERNAWIHRNDADIEIAGKLVINKAEGEPVRVIGEIRLVRGWYAFQGRRFELEQGTITFTGATPPEPTFDVTAVYKTRDNAYRIEVHITGSAKKPTLDLTSDPPLEKADILAVLLFGKPAHQLGRGESVALQRQALQLAAGYVVPELRTSVMDALGLDTLEIEMPEGTGTPGRVSAGRYVAEDVFLSLGQEFGPRAGQVVGIEYSFGYNISARASTSTRGTSALDLFWHWRY